MFWSEPATKEQLSQKEAMKLALEALLLWEEMLPKTSANRLRNEAIEALQKHV